MYLLEVRYTLTPKIYPANADKPIAIVPQIVILRIAFLMLEPPVLAEVAPRMIKKMIVKP